jgi:hypothetical protein
MTDEKVYGVITEWKAEQPLVMEGPLGTYQEAIGRMRLLAGRPEVIRVAIFKAIYTEGNKTLIPEESQP